MARLGFDAVFLCLMGCLIRAHALRVSLRPAAARESYQEGETAEFACSASPPADGHPYHVRWSLGGEFSELATMTDTKSFNVTLLHRGTSTLTCIVDGVDGAGGEGSANTSLDLVVYKRPTNLALEWNPVVVRGKVYDRLYRFRCHASGFVNLANHTTWLIDRRGRREQIKTTCDWLLGESVTEHGEASTEICLNVTTEDHDSSRIVCRVEFPDDGAFEEVAAYLPNEPYRPTPIPGTTERANTLRSSGYPIRDTAGLHCVTAVVIPVAVSAVILVAMATLFAGRRRYRERARAKKAELAASNDAPEIGACELRRSKRDYNFPPERLTLHEILGSGNFGHVYRATADGIYRPGMQSDVAVKILKESAHVDVVVEFKKEIAVQSHLVNHPNVAAMLGYCMNSQPFYLIMEYLPGGNLQKYLRGKRNAWKDGAVEGAPPACPCRLLTFASEIANGMDYLSSVGCIHRDLATRNILLSDDLVCKLSDFGLARDVSETEQYERTSLGLIPVRWLAFESLLENTYTAMSDVWSFGVLLWEIVTLGAHPYRGMSSSEIIDALVEGYRLPSPGHCGKQLYKVMKECWLVSPNRRPSFVSLKQLLDSMVPDAQVYLAMEEFVADKYA